jgi:hypothetical protein
MDDPQGVVARYGQCSGAGISANHGNDRPPLAWLDGSILGKESCGHISGQFRGGVAVDDPASYGDT